MDNNLQAFIALLRAGLWEKEVRLLSFQEVDFNEVCRIAEEQSVTGLIAAGLDHLLETKAPQDVVLRMVGAALQMEQRNTSMNQFVERIVKRMRDVGIYVLLLKGQGIAQCYERPLWRTCGDVDLFLSDENYKKAKEYLVPLATRVESERKDAFHLGMTFDQWVVELHGSLRCGLSKRIDKKLDEIKKEIFFGGHVRSWIDGKTQVFLPHADEDAIYVFTHILDHFYKGGIGLRQICDWCRLLWTYKDSLNSALLESRIKEMKIMSLWKAFGAFAVEYLGMPSEAMPLYSPDEKWKRKAERICAFVMEVGNFGHNRDNSYYEKPYLVRKAFSFGRRCSDMFYHARNFPLDTIRFFPTIVFNGVRSALKHEG